MSALGSVFSWPSQPSTSLIVTTTALATATLLVLGRSAGWPRRRKILSNPLQTYPPGSQQYGELETLIYRPDTFPGARDVETPVSEGPFGLPQPVTIVSDLGAAVRDIASLRIWAGRWSEGPVRARHQHIVHHLDAHSERPCQTRLPRHAVCTFFTAPDNLLTLRQIVARTSSNMFLQDLFGRGFSDGVGDLPHDERLYVTQILLVLASSPLPWTGNEAFRLVGYSLGGGISVHFANAFPHLVSSLVLLAPAGLIRPESFGAVSRILFSSGIVPETIVSGLTRRRLQQPIAAAKVPKHAVPGDAQADVAVAEAADASSGGKLIPLERHVLWYVRWMVKHHNGFVPAFMSCIRHADRTLTNQEESWRKITNRRPGSTAILLAERDEIINLQHYQQTALPLVGGEDHVTWRVLPGAHDFVMTHSEVVMEHLDQFWGA